MSRRKQVKPQHINLEEDQGEQQPQQLALKFADAAPVVSAVREPGAPMNNPGTGEDMNGDRVKVKRPCWEQTHICEICSGAFFSLSTFLEHKKNCTKSLPVFIMNESEGLVPSEDSFRAVESYQPHNPSSKESPREHGVSSWDMKEKPGAESVLHLNMKTALPPTSQDLSDLPKGKVANTNVTLQALRGTKVAVGQQRANMLPASLPGANSIPWFLEQVRYLQQHQLRQHLQQIQFTEQIHIWVSMWARLYPPLRQPRGSHVSQQVQGLSLDPSKQASLPHTNIPPTTSSVPPGLVSIAPRPDGSRVLPNHLPGALIPQAPGSVPFQSPFSTVALDPSTNGKGKPSNVPPVDVIPKDKAGNHMYKCNYCSKVFGTDNSLQVHLRSHFGERPFMCSVCGQWFTTEDDLKAHFHQHFQVKANPQLFGESHNKMATGIGVPYALSVPVPEDESSFNKSVLVSGTPRSLGLPQNLSCGTNPKDLMGGSLANYPQPWPPESEDGYRFSGVGPNHNYPRVGSFQGRGAPEPGSETLKQLVENNDKATTNPNECPICHRVLSSQRSLKMHYQTHTRESTYKCKTCDRIFSSKHNLNTHLKTHQTNTSTKTKHSCPICQKKFSNAVTLQRHIRMHMGGQIPNTLVLENPCDFRDPEPMKISENSSTSAICHNDVESTYVDKVGSQDAPSSSSKIPMPLLSTHSTSPMPGLSITAPLVVGPAAVRKSRGKSWVESGGLTKLCPSVIGDQKYSEPKSQTFPGRSHPFQGHHPSQWQNRRKKSKFPDVGGKESSENSHTDMEGWSSLPSTVAKAQPTYVKDEVPGAFGPTTISPGMASSLAAQPCQQDKQHGHTQFRKNSLASAVQIHEWTHTGEKKLFMSNICRQAFTTKDNLQAHYMTHGANNSSAHCGRKQGIENTMVLLGTDGKRLPEMFPQETTVPSVNVDPVVCNQYTTMLSGGLANNTNNSSVIQSVDLSTLLVSQGTSSAVDNTTVSKIDGSQSAVSAGVEKPGAADSIPKHQSPHLLEAKLQES
uniref:C2H2-type domain-containing protein n=1 Tax=Myotis lucifugus TaxID=59463 RepID=G1Q6X6_MYOLU